MRLGVSQRAGRKLEDPFNTRSGVNGNEWDVDLGQGCRTRRIMFEEERPPTSTATNARSRHGGPSSARACNRSMMINSRRQCQSTACDEESGECLDRAECDRLQTDAVSRSCRRGPLSGFP